MASSFGFGFGGLGYGRLGGYGRNYGDSRRGVGYGYESGYNSAGKGVGIKEWDNGTIYGKAAENKQVYAWGGRGYGGYDKRPLGRGLSYYGSKGHDMLSGW